MYIAIYNRYSTNRLKIAVTLHRATEANSSASESPLVRDRAEAFYFRFFLLGGVFIGTQQGVQTVTVWISGNSVVTTK